MDIETERLGLVNAVEAEYKALPLRPDAALALNHIPNKQKPELLVQINDYVRKETDLKRLFYYDEMESVLQKPSSHEVCSLEKSEDTNFPGATSFNGEIGMVTPETLRSSSERLEFLINQGIFGNSTLEHEIGHRRVFSIFQYSLLGWIENLRRDVQSQVNSESYKGAVELHETYARLCSIDYVCGSMDYVGGEDNKFNEYFYNTQSWAEYYKVNNRSINIERVKYSVEAILCARCFHDEGTIAKAILLHGGWDEKTQTYPGMESLIKNISREDRGKYAEIYRLRCQLARLQTVGIARRLVLQKEAELKETDQLKSSLLDFMRRAKPL